MKMSYSGGKRMNQDFKISIIIPAYNVQNYISRCLESLINQTYKNLEIIVINDGSKDNTLNIINEFAKKDNRIIVINQENKGVSDSRNAGLKKVTGTYITFVDSDDWLDNNSCEEMINYLISNNADIAMFGYIREYENNSIPKALFNENERVFNKEEIMKYLHRRIYGPINEETASPEKLNAIVPLWGKIYKADLIKDIQFRSRDELGLCEDRLL